MLGSHTLKPRVEPSLYFTLFVAQSTRCASKTLAEHIHWGRRVARLLAECLLQAGSGLRTLRGLCLSVPERSFQGVMPLSHFTGDGSEDWGGECVQQNNGLRMTATPSPRTCEHVVLQDRRR